MWCVSHSSSGIAWIERLKIFLWAFLLRIREKTGILFLGHRGFKFEKGAWRSQPRSSYLLDPDCSKMHPPRPELRDNKLALAAGMFWLSLVSFFIPCPFSLNIIHLPYRLQGSTWYNAVAGPHERCNVFYYRVCATRRKERWHEGFAYDDWNPRSELPCLDAAQRWDSETINFVFRGRCLLHHRVASCGIDRQWNSNLDLPSNRFVLTGTNDKPPSFVFFMLKVCSELSMDIKWAMQWPFMLHDLLLDMVELLSRSSDCIHFLSILSEVLSAFASFLLRFTHHYADTARNRRSISSTAASWRFRLSPLWFHTFSGSPSSARPIIGPLTMSKSQVVTCCASRVYLIVHSDLPVDRPRFAWLEIVWERSRFALALTHSRCWRADLLQLLDDPETKFPLVFKPNMCTNWERNSKEGSGISIVEDKIQALKYLEIRYRERRPEKSTNVQWYDDSPIEATVFYYKYPYYSHGIIKTVWLKVTPINATKWVMQR
jgi:hypothetical protein